MDPNSSERLMALIREKICALCVDANVDGSCNSRAGGTCTLMAKLPLAAEAILKVSSDRIEPYIQSIRDHVCVHCELWDPDGSCARRDTDNCMLSSYLPLMVEAIEEHFGRSFPPTSC
jgi:hypothetical protein